MKKFLKNKLVILSIIAVFSIIYIWNSKTIKKNNVTDSEEIISESFEEEKEEINKENLEKNEEKVDEEEEKIDDSEEENNIETENKIFVYVTGEVVNPGIAMLNENSRIIDAINSAGGITNNANISKINLAYVLKDGMKVSIPSKEDLKKDSNFEYITMSSGDGKNDDTSENQNSLSSKTDKNITNKSMVNINTATQTELETLPGIGPSTALKIINYRNENGKFSSIDEIKNVNGIGDSKFENIKKYITV